MDVGDVLWLCDVEDVVVAEEWQGVCGELFSSVVGFGEVEVL